MSFHALYEQWIKAAKAIEFNNMVSSYYCYKNTVTCCPLSLSFVIIATSCSSWLVKYSNI